MTPPARPLRFGMVIDLDACTGCGACAVACQAENNVPPGDGGTDPLRSLLWLGLYEIGNGHPFPLHESLVLPRPCLHCENPPCTFVCPVNATGRDPETGIVFQVAARCIGCRYCVAACPYQARVFNWRDPGWPEPMAEMLSPEVSVRTRGVVEKCTFCNQRWLRAREAARAGGRPPESALYTPACAEACPTRAIAFGNLADPESEVSRLSRDPRAFRLMARLGTEPRVWYLSRRDWARALCEREAPK